MNSSLPDQTQEKRGDDFRLIVMSATLDAEKFVKYLGASKAAYIQVRSFSTDLVHLVGGCLDDPPRDYSISQSAFSLF